MKAFRLSASVLTLTALSLLAACGGGGGGGGVTPPANGGGGTPPTSAPTQSPTQGPTQSPTQAPTQAPTQTPVGTNSALTINATENFGPNGALWYTSGTASWANTAGGDSAAPTGGPIDNMTCTLVTEGASFPSTAYSQHMFVGILYNGVEQALPQALGMVAPVAPKAGTPTHPTNTQEVEQNQCEYNVHTHDYSGLVHIEDTAYSQTPSYNYSVPYGNLQTLLDIWKATLDPVAGLTAGSNSLAGPVAIYSGIPTTRDTNGNDLVVKYSPVAVTPSSIPLARHNAIWIVIGTPPAAGLPQVTFGESN